MKKRNYIEVCITTINGIQHLRLHSFLKNSELKIKNEQITKSNNKFGYFIIVVEDTLLNSLYERKDLYDTIDLLEGEEKRWQLYKTMKNENMAEHIKDFMFSFDIEGIDWDKIVSQTNETTVKLFEKNPSFAQEYILTDELTVKEKLEDLTEMIRYFEEKEQYEKCKVLLDIKDRIQELQDGDE